MEIDEYVRRLGGVATWGQLVDEYSAHVVRKALESERLARVSHGLYALPNVKSAELAARRLSGVLSFTSAALHHGWPVKLPPERPHVTVPRHRKVSSARRAGVDVHYGDVATDGVATTPEQTVIDCARFLPYPDALAVADSALRAGVGRHTLLIAAGKAPRTHRGKALAVVEAADSRAANPFESTVRGISHEFPLRLVPQVTIPGYGRPDLYDERRNLIVECDSFTFHSERSAVVKDVERYNAAALASLGLLRFAWEHAVLRPDYVRNTLRDWLAIQAAQERLAVRRRCPHCAA